MLIHAYILRVHQLEVIRHKEGNVVFLLHSACLGAQLEDRQSTGVIDEQGRLGQLLRRHRQAAEIHVGQETIADVAQVDPGARTESNLSPSDSADISKLNTPTAFGPKLKEFAFGRDERPLDSGDEIKSISGEETFLKDTDDRKVLRTCLRAQAEDISARLKRRRLGAHTVQVKVRYGDFTTLTRQITVETTLNAASDIYRLGCFLLGREKLVSRPLRLLGLGVASLREPSGQQLVLL